MKIGVVGCGGVGAFYAARLAQAGHDVHCLVRSDYEIVRSRGGYLIDDHFHKLPRTLVPVNAHKTPEEIGVCDMVFVALKTTANDQYSRLLTPLVGAGTVVIPSQNGLGNAEKLAEIFGAERVIGAINYCTLVRVEPGIIETFGRTELWLAEVFGGPRERTFEFAKLFEAAQLPAQVKNSLAEILWKKLFWNIPFNGLCVAHNIDCGELVDDPALVDRAFKLMYELQAAARANGVPVEQAHIDYQMNYTRDFCRGYRPSTLLDFRAGREIELESIWGEALRRGNAAGVEMPEFAALYQTLKNLSQQQKTSNKNH